MQTWDPTDENYHLSNRTIFNAWARGCEFSLMAAPGNDVNDNSWILPKAVKARNF